MKKILIFTILALMSVMAVNAQTETQPPPRQALRVGVGVSLPGATYVTEPAISIDYQYVLSDYFDININFHHANFSYDYYWDDGVSEPVDGRFYDPSVRLMITPLPKWFRYFQIGIGIKYLYGKQTYGREIYLNSESNYTGRVYDYMRQEYHKWGFDIPVRLYIVNNNKYQLFVDYYLNFLHEERSYPYFQYGIGDLGVNFGLKF